MIQRQARDTARLVGLHDRGVLAPGYRADLNVIDFDRLRVHQPELLYDLPPVAVGSYSADGYRHTISSPVSRPTPRVRRPGAPGRLVRGAQRGPTA